MAAAPWPASRDFVEAIQNPALAFVDPELKALTPAIDRLGMPLVASGQFAYVFKLNSANGGAQAVRCFRGFLGDREQRYQAIDDHLNKVSIPSLAGFEYDPQGILVVGRRYPALVMEWIDGLPLDVYVAGIFQRADVLRFLADLWLRIVSSLRTAGVAHGDLQHGNIIIQNGKMRLVDLDGMFVPAMAGWKASELGHQHYQHPARAIHHFSGALDNFSALVIYISFLALAESPELWSRFHDENLIFTKDDFKAPGSSALFAKLRKLNNIQGLVAALDMACRQDPMHCPYLLDLVTFGSKLPVWMRDVPDVQIKAVTREAEAQTWGPPAVPPQYRRETVGGPSPTAQQSATASIPASQSASASAPLPVGVQPTRAPVFSRQAVATLKYGLNYAFINIWWSWIWFPLCRSLLQWFGLTQNTAGLLSIAGFIGGCLWLGHQKAINLGQPQSISTPPAIAGVPGAQPSTPAPANATKPTWQHTPASPAASYTPSNLFVGNKLSMVFHVASCYWAPKISPRNRTNFSSSSEASAKGYRRCRACHP